MTERSSNVPPLSPSDLFEILFSESEGHARIRIFQVAFAEYYQQNFFRETPLECLSSVAGQNLDLLTPEEVGIIIDLLDMFLLATPESNAHLQ